MTSGTTVKKSASVPQAQEKTGEGATVGRTGLAGQELRAFRRPPQEAERGRKPALAASPRILWAAQPGCTEAFFVLAPTRHPAGPGF